MEKDLTTGIEEAQAAKQASKQASISYLRIFTTICVIWLHTCSTLCENLDLFEMNDKQKLFFNTSYQAMYWTVPIFFMITGMLFLRTGFYVETKDWLLKYSKRILLALFIFGIPYAALKMVMTEGLSISLLGKSILAVISDTGFGHLWYLYVLIGIYLIMPVLKRFCDNASVDEMTLVVITLFALSFFFPLISSLIGHKIAFASQMLYPVFYVLMGHLVFENKHRFNRRSLWLVTSGCVLLIWVFNAFDIAPRIWTRYDSPLIAILAISIFALFITQDWKDRKWLWGMDRICFGAYLIHPLFIQFTYRFLKITPIKFVCYPVMAVLFAIVFVALAFLTAWIMRKVGVLRKYVL